MSESARSRYVVLVCGRRTSGPRDCVFRTLDALHADRPITLLVHGAAKGADSLVRLWAAKRDVPEMGHRANWDAYGKAAGAIRNQRMLAESPDLVVAFPGGPGTADMVRRSTAASVRVLDLGLVLA